MLQVSTIANNGHGRMEIKREVKNIVKGWQEIGKLDVLGRNLGLGNRGQYETLI